MDDKFDYHKAAGILIKDRSLLVVREREKDFFVAPGGGVIELTESPREALIRELKEEVAVAVEEKDLEAFGIFTAVAAGSEKKTLKMEVFLVKNWQGEPVPSQGEEVIEEIRWINYQNKSDLKLGSIFEHEVMPRLKNRNLID